MVICLTAHLQEASICWMGRTTATGGLPRRRPTTPASRNASSTPTSTRHKARTSYRAEESSWTWASDVIILTFLPALVTQSRHPNLSPKTVPDVITWPSNVTLNIRTRYSSWRLSPAILTKNPKFIPDTFMQHTTIITDIPLPNNYSIFLPDILTHRQLFLPDIAIDIFTYIAYPTF